ncbi:MULTISPECIES: F0F1 ATP synthase subunit gamma [unclassified Lactobacillus]|uniref:F0F1 ATP synthase subunit gamma n=1 Tax=unclassified Lactobacillus TaxID=2620435 RepID=UPI000EFD03E9|nr:MULTISPECIES: F0F1 ATP synthase subunit gamma [unclassified Lactobacillus]RMC40869.1 F0F1 ATP synthase subunit gamma [Lactobacillus sp. ESL0237]RMC44624.1 F0F1 ATP synthase subunit gamma [Lactobacillus sp. ESL0234]RMC45931.1 F0F1 ATP synthase subunit gamma [Lactobacillus sp. ESL0236]RMC46268.1 F0F1 ATP synthase subunit gamma [Lactobacillus sp. ESL0230]RMC51332.1 F0F1 ATP synthase subunit gamma [Lactobacillus sp. ESL0225]
MPASLLELKKKIASVKQTGKITEAMRMVSASKLNQTEKRDEGYTVYNNHIRQTLSRLMSAEVINHLHKENLVVDEDSISKIDYENVFGLGIVSNLVQSRKEIKSTGYLVITGDRGLVGSYNSAVIKNMMGLVQDAKAEHKDIKILAIGSVGAEFFKKNNLNVVYENNAISDVPTFEEILPIVSTAIKMYLNGVYDELYVCYTHHVNTLSSAFRVEKMMPINNLDIGVKEAEAHKNLEYDIEPDVNTVLTTLIPQFIRSGIYGAILDAKTAEHASSMTAMQSATDNVDELVSSLTTKLNRARQAEITTEITEIVSGANALK